MEGTETMADFVDSVSKVSTQQSCLDWSLTESLLHDDGSDGLENGSYEQHSCSPDRILESLTDHNRPLFTPTDLNNSPSRVSLLPPEGTISVDSLDSSMTYHDDPGTHQLVEKCISQADHSDHYRIACIQGSLTGSLRASIAGNSPRRHNRATAASNGHQEQQDTSCETLVSESANLLAFKSASRSSNLMMTSSNNGPSRNPNQNRDGNANYCITNGSNGTLTDEPLANHKYQLTNQHHHNIQQQQLKKRQYSPNNPFVPLYDLQSSSQTSSVGSDLASPPPPPNYQQFRLFHATKLSPTSPMEKNGGGGSGFPYSEAPPPPVPPRVESQGTITASSNGVIRRRPQVPAQLLQQQHQAHHSEHEEQDSLHENLNFYNRQHRNTIMNRRPRSAWVPHPHDSEFARPENVGRRRETSQFSSGYHSAKHSDERLFIRRTNSVPAANGPLDPSLVPPPVPPPPPPQQMRTFRPYSQHDNAAIDPMLNRKVDFDAYYSEQQQHQSAGRGYGGNEFSSGTNEDMTNTNSSNSGAGPSAALYVCYPKYSLPDLSFLTGQEQNVIMSPSEPPTVRQRLNASATRKKGASRPKSLSDFESLAKHAENFDHINDWDSLEILLDNTQFKELVAKLKTRQQSRRTSQILISPPETCSAGGSATSLPSAVRMRPKAPLYRVNSSEEQRRILNSGSMRGGVPKRFSLQEPLRNIYEEDHTPSPTSYGPGCGMPRSVTMPSCNQFSLPSANGQWPGPPPGFPPYHHVPPHGMYPAPVPPPIPYGGYSFFPPHHPSFYPQPQHPMLSSPMNFMSPSSYGIMSYGHPPLGVPFEGHTGTSSVDQLSEMLANNLSLHKLMNVIATHDPNKTGSSRPASRSTPVTPSRSQNSFEPIIESPHEQQHETTAPASKPSTTTPKATKPQTSASTRPAAQKNATASLQKNLAKVTSQSKPSSAKESSKQRAPSGATNGETPVTTKVILRRKNNPATGQQQQQQQNGGSARRRPTSLQTTSASTAAGRSMIPVPKSLRSPPSGATSKK